MVVVNPCHMTQTQAPLLYVPPQTKQPRKRSYNQSKAKQKDYPIQPQFIMSPSNAQGNTAESSIIHVVFGAEDKTMTQNTALGSHPMFISHPRQPNNATTKIPEPAQKQPQQKSNKRKKSSDFSPEIKTPCSTSVQNESIPPKELINNITSEQPKAPEKLNDGNKNNNESPSINVSKPSEISGAGRVFHPAKDNLRRKLRESYAISFSLEKECFKLESERIECLHGVKVRKEKIEELQKQIAELEQKAVELGNSKQIVETNWKACQEKEKEMKKKLFSADSKPGNAATDSAKRLKQQ